MNKAHAGVEALLWVRLLVLKVKYPAEYEEAVRQLRASTYKPGSGRPARP